MKLILTVDNLIKPNDEDLYIFMHITEGMNFITMEYYNEVAKDIFKLHNITTEEMW